MDIAQAKELIANHDKRLPEALIIALNSGYDNGCISESVIISCGELIERHIERHIEYEKAVADPENNEPYAAARARRLAEGRGPTELTPEEQERVAKRVAEEDISVASVVREIAAFSTSTTEDTNA